MNNGLLKVCGFGLVLTGVVGCTWVKPESGAEAVELRAANQVAGCERLAETSASVRDRVAAVQRSATKVEEELTTLARNSAFEVGGNVLVPTGQVRDGRRSFVIYRCPD